MIKKRIKLKNYIFNLYFRNKNRKNRIFTIQLHIHKIESAILRLAQIMSKNNELKGQSDFLDLAEAAS